jgi:hypothetical protein
VVSSEWVFGSVKEKVDVLGHEDVAEDVEVVTSPEFFEGLFEGGAGVDVVEVGEPAVTTEGDEMIVSFGVVSLETARHGVMVIGAG